MPAIHITSVTNCVVFPPFPSSQICAFGFFHGSRLEAEGVAAAAESAGFVQAAASALKAHGTDRGLADFVIAPLTELVYHEDTTFGVPQSIALELAPTLVRLMRAHLSNVSLQHCALGLAMACCARTMVCALYFRSCHHSCPRSLPHLGERSRAPLCWCSDSSPVTPRRPSPTTKWSGRPFRQVRFPPLCRQDDGAPRCALFGLLVAKYLCHSLPQVWWKRPQQGLRCMHRTQASSNRPQQCFSCVSAAPSTGPLASTSPHRRAPRPP